MMDDASESLEKMVRLICTDAVSRRPAGDEAVRVE
jgi:hypothetical protein